MVLLIDVVFNHSKIQDEIKSQPRWGSTKYSTSCFQSFKDTRRNQITTKTLKVQQRELLFSIIQRYKTKSNHNQLTVFKFSCIVVFNHSKIQDEIKSQHHIIMTEESYCCFQSFKDTRRNQITTNLISFCGM